MPCLQDCNCTTLDRSLRHSDPKFTYSEHVRHFIHTHNNDVSFGLVTAVIGAGAGYYASRMARGCVLMFGVGILGLEALSRLEWATVDWHSVSTEVTDRCLWLTGSALGPFPWSWARRGFVAGLLIGFSLENVGRNNNGGNSAIPAE